MADRDREKDGEYKETYTADSALDVLKQADKPFVTAGDVADALDCSRRTARRKLNELEGVRKETVGARAAVWWLHDGPDDE